MENRKRLLHEKRVKKLEARIARLERLLCVKNEVHDENGLVMYDTVDEYLEDLVENNGLDVTDIQDELFDLLDWAQRGRMDLLQDIVDHVSELQGLSKMKVCIKVADAVEDALYRVGVDRSDTTFVPDRRNRR